VNWLSQSKPNGWQKEYENQPDDENFQKVLKNCVDALPNNWILSGFIFYLAIL
jgi:hypothetical protein